MSTEKDKKIANGIDLYFHCSKCLSSGKKDKIAVGWTKKGIQVWCDSCNSNVLALDFGGLKVKSDSNPETYPEK